MKGEKKMGNTHDEVPVEQLRWRCDSEGMKASHKDGVLEIIIPKSKKEKRREIEVRVS